MLKRMVGNELWCVSQPDHGAAAGYLAAHWGNGEFRIAIDPYPFDQDPLEVTLRARILDPENRHPADFHTWWQARPHREVRFRFILQADGTDPMPTIPGPEGR